MSTDQVVDRARLDAPCECTECTCTQETPMRVCGFCRRGMHEEAER